MRIARYGFALMAVLAVSGVMAGGAHAQTVVKDAHFKLPFEAKWDNKVLPAGDYTLSVAEVHTGRGLIYRITFAGGGKTSTILTIEPLGPSAGGRSMLVAVPSGRSYRIRELDLPNADLVLTFAAPKAEKPLSAESPAVSQNVPILLAEK